MSTEERQPEQFHVWLKGQLRRRDWSQSDLARRLDMSKGVIGNWVRGQRLPSSESCDRLADVLGLDVDYVLTLAGHRPLDPDVDPDSPERLLLPLIRRIDWKSDPRRLKAIERDLRWLIEEDREEQR